MVRGRDGNQTICTQILSLLLISWVTLALPSLPQFPYLYNWESTTVFAIILKIKLGPFYRGRSCRKYLKWTKQRLLDPQKAQSPKTEYRDGALHISPSGGNQVVPWWETEGYLNLGLCTMVRRPGPKISRARLGHGGCPQVYLELRAQQHICSSRCFLCVLSFFLHCLENRYINVQ